MQSLKLVREKSKIIGIPFQKTLEVLTVKQGTVVKCEHSKTRVIKNDLGGILGGCRHDLDIRSGCDRSGGPF